MSRSTKEKPRSSAATENQAGPLGTIHIPEYIIKDNCRDAMICRGHCMSPTIMDGAIVGFDPNDREIVEGEMYIFEIARENPLYQVKRVTRYEPPIPKKYPGLIVLGTDNENYLNMIYNLHDIKVIGHVKWVYNKGAETR